MACSKISKDQWDWRAGESYQTKTPYGTYNFNYFTCGTYYFDGTLNVVKFPAGMTLYHGSSAMANANVEFPLGRDFYEPHDISTESDVNFDRLKDDLIKSGDTVVTELTKYIPISMGWFGNPDVAKIYSGLTKGNDTDLQSTCGSKCVMAYTLNRDAIFVVLDDSHNILSILTNASVPENVKRALRVMFDLPPRLELKAERYNRYKIDKTRKSFQDTDAIFARWLCENIELCHDLRCHNYI